ncbi:MAG: hypothetical protein N2319_05075 [Candidatus Kapabacteria bacterium]|nr:hypothetical protein [Candidatus Kapabacteria bacterium]
MKTLNKPRQKINQIYFYFLLILFTDFIMAKAQTVSEDLLKFNGSLNLSSDLYSVNGIQARQPGNVQRLLLRTNLRLFNQIDIPFEVSLSNSDSRFLQPFNQFGVSPRITDWLRFHGGYFYTNLSELSFGDIKIYGGGLELTPGNFRLKAFYGRSKVAREPDSLKGFGGIYNQTTYGFLIGYGNENVAYLNLSFFKSIDDSASIKRISISEGPIENLVSSASFGFKIFKPLFIRAELAASLFSSDIQSQTISTVKIPKTIFTPKVSTQVDGAAKLGIEIEPQSFWALRFGAKWIGPGFYSAGYSNLQNDLLELTIDPTLRLLENKLNLRSSIGIRKNNLRNNKLSTTNRFIGLFAADYQVTDFFGINLQYNNNQIKATQYSDSLKISNVFNLISISPRFNFSAFNGINNLSLTYSYQNSEDSNPLFRSKVSNKTNTINLIHSVFFPSTLSFTTSILHNHVTLPNLNVKITSINEIISHQFFKNKLSVSLNLGYSITQVTNTNGFYIFGIRAGYSLDKFGNISFNLTNNNFKSGDPLSPSFNEFIGNLQYSINF